MQDKLNSAGASIGTTGQWILRAPSGTTISRIHLSRMLGMEGGSGWRPYGKLDGDIFEHETCTVSPGYDECNIGVNGDASIDYAVNSASIAYGIECISSSGCVTGATIHAARAAIYSSRVTITDPVSPILTSPTGALVTEAGYHRGTEAVTFNGTDNTGLQELRVYVDDAQRATSTLACDYTYTVPCANPGVARTLSVDLSMMSGRTRLVPDGAHSVQVAAVDAAGNETRSAARSIVVDDTAPAAPSSLQTSTGSAWQTSRAFTATWTNPSGQTAPIDTAHWTLCPQGSSSGCVMGSQPVFGSTETIAGLKIPGEGAWELAVHLQDAAGNMTASNASRTTVRYDVTAPVAPADLTIEPRRQSEPNFVVFWPWSITEHAQLARVLWRLCPTGLPTGCQSDSQPFHGPRGEIGSSLPAEGDWTLDVRLQDIAGNVSAPASVHLRYQLVTTPTPTPAPTPIASAMPPAPEPSAVPPGTRASSPTTARAAAHMRLTAAVLVRARRTLTVAGRTALRATGRVRLTAEIRRRDRTRKLTATATIRRGVFRTRLRLPRADAAGRATVTARYAGSTRHKPAVASRRVTVRSH